MSPATPRTILYPLHFILHTYSELHRYPAPNRPILTSNHPKNRILNPKNAHDGSATTPNMMAAEVRQMAAGGMLMVGSWRAEGGQRRAEGMQRVGEKHAQLPSPPSATTLPVRTGQLKLRLSNANQGDLAMFTTRTGSFPIGFRRGWSEWQRNLDTMIAWTKKQGITFIDLGNDADQCAKTVLDAGLQVGSVDLPEWKGLMSADPAKRAAALEKNAAYVKTCSALGIKTYFIVMLPEDATLPRKENFKYMIESFNALGPMLDQHQSRLVIEGWPGPGAQCCTPESYRAALKASNSKSIGINFDPSHLLRMNIDPIRFVDEFADRIYHVHGKDTEILSENTYEYGTEQPTTFGTPRKFGAMTWRYTIPGHGVFRWSRAFEILVSRGYHGLVSIELEDDNFNGTTEGEQAGILASAHYLASC